MNSAHYVEPKFPPSEEYSQNSYMHGHHEDFYRNVAAQNYGFVDQRRFGQENFSPNHHGSYGLVQPPPAHGGTGLQEPHHQAYHTGSPISQSPESVPSPSPTSSGGSLPPCSQASSASTPVIYPWMKKVHMGSAGKSLQPMQSVLSWYKYYSHRGSSTTTCDIDILSTSTFCYCRKSHRKWGNKSHQVGS